ncbi:Hypothetical protein IALB_0952 [Ignavibacterium album JCM 16511]|uniref:DUF2141 domain-containing protein n=1 Tax=Ignavibacterium album (strain DSM 19864 / JCM 16511 / NBRC 101810 / Mat9-16) TaxID=945713 RepID=I0AI57_IGNAJ|nr:DUF2141 domain-containing protein [Ignavibacterium album]AFH48664.1 Hypothetical protein IALB_0952 [Ignavibacterium album JCM 16511]
MKFKFSKYLIFFALFSIVIYAGDNQKGRLIVKIKGLKNDQGTVKIALCNSSENYKDDLSPFKAAIIEIKNNQAIAVFDNLPAGNYAVKAFHDENNNDDFDTNFLGIPKEDYGFSNNVKGLFGPPSWDAAKFQLNKSNQIVEIIFN